MKISQRIVSVAAVAAAALAATASPQPVKVDSSIPAYQRASGVSGTLNSVGSDTMNNLMTLWGEAFAKLYPNVKIDPNSTKDNDDREEIGVALSYYYNRHNLKVQADWRQLKDDAANSGAGTTSQEIRLQTQFIF